MTWLLWLKSQLTRRTGKESENVSELMTLKTRYDFVDNRIPTTLLDGEDTRHYMKRKCMCREDTHGFDQVMRTLKLN